MEPQLVPQTTDEEQALRSQFAVEGKGAVDTTSSDAERVEGNGSEQVPSPYLPGTRIRYAWDSTCLESFKRCPRLYYYQYIEGWQKPGDNVDLRFGQEYHSALESYDWYRFGDNEHEGIDHEAAIHYVVRELLERTANFRPDHKYKNRHNLIRSVIWYLDKFKNDPAKTVILESGKPAVELSFRFELDWGPKGGLKMQRADESGYDITNIQSQPYLLCGHLDRIVEFQGFNFIMDRKTTKSTPGDYYFDTYSPHNQMTLYTIAGQVCFEMPVKGVIIDAVQVAIEFTRPVRGMTYRTPDYLDEWLDQLHYWLDQAEKCAVEDKWPLNDTSCDKYGGCKFREVCSKSPGVRQVYLKSNFVKLPEEEIWNPLRSR